MSDLISREITKEMVKEYCQKRGLVLITREFFEELWIRYERGISRSCGSDMRGEEDE